MVREENLILEESLVWKKEGGMEKSSVIDFYLYGLVRKIGGVQANTFIERVGLLPRWFNLYSALEYVYGTLFDNTDRLPWQ